MEQPGYNNQGSVYDTPVLCSVISQRFRNYHGRLNYVFALAMNLQDNRRCHSQAYIIDDKLSDPNDFHSSTWPRHSHKTSSPSREIVACINTLTVHYMPTRIIVNEHDDTLIVRV